MLVAAPAPRIAQNESISCFTRDDVEISCGMHLWYFDPFSDAELRSADVFAVNNYGPELITPRGILVFSRKAVWHNKEKAKKNGPPYEVYIYNRRNGVSSQVLPV